ncbi:hypothetical protein V1514DRAFT_368182 [Lipomyces japonicus]|uniref:uncharacterized protein n=1 Tax=Lipomyces japonicus TaxID=56871 RepID=UPI0034CD673F
MGSLHSVWMLYLSNLGLSIPRISEDDGNNDDSSASVRSEMNAAMRELTTIIWKAGGFRFRHKSTTFSSFRYHYQCSQDLKNVKEYQLKVNDEKQRDGTRMNDFHAKIN